MRALAVGTAVLLVALAPAAIAQTRVQLEVNPRRVGVGERFFVQATATSEAGGALPVSPRLSLPPGFSALGPSQSTQKQITISGGQVQHREGVSATWTVNATRPGTFRIGPASFMVAGAKVEGQSVMVEVVPAAQSGGQPQRPPGFVDPFDFFRQRGFPSFPGFGRDDPNAADDPALLPPVPEEFRITQAKDPTAFLLARVTPTRIVVGEQVTLSIYAYGSRGPFREVNPTEPRREDFLSYTLLENSYGEQQHRVPLGEVVWHVTKVREFALFPIHSGNLVIGPMRMGFEGRGYLSTGPNQGFVRESERLEVAVDEPPLAGRPAGYRVGDVGRYSLSANVEPRQIDAGDALSVIVKLEGVGNLPHRVNVPARRGIDWLEPTLTGDIEPQAGIVQGYRKFSYVVRVDEPGSVELGEITLPFWDPKRSAYDVARASLGKLEVQAGKRRSEAEPRERSDTLDTSLTPRRALGTPASPRRSLADTRWFWALLLCTPLGVVLASGATMLGRILRQRWRDRHEAHPSRAQLAVRDAQAALAQNDAPAAASACERALVVAVEGATGLRLRAFLRSELKDKLEGAGLAPELSNELSELLESCDRVRFTSEDQNAERLVERARSIVSRLSRVRRGRAAAGSEI